MPFDVVMPRLGWNMEKGILVKWLKQDGEYVQAGEALFVVEADKASQEVEALESGILHIPAGSPPLGSEAPVGTLLAYLLQAGEEDALSNESPRRQEKSPLTSPRGQAETLGQSPYLAATVADIAPAPAPGRDATYRASAPQMGAKAPKISPRARRVAEEMGINWATLQGSGRTGRIVERDIRQLAAHPPALVPNGARASSPLRGDDALSSYPQRLIAERMVLSAHTVAAVTLTTEADATELVRLRKQFAADPSRPAPSCNDLLVKLLAQALVEHPVMNSRMEDDAIVQSSTVNIGIAIDTEHGLLMPVLRDVQAKPLLQIIRESAAMMEAARAGRIDPDDLCGATFTLINLGMYDIDAFTPVINAPECAVLGVGRITPKQVVVDADAGRVAIRHLMFLSLTFDQRLVDGAPSARFLQRIKQYIEQPLLSLMSCAPK